MKRYSFLILALFLSLSSFAQDTVVDSTQSITITLPDGKTFTIEGVNPNEDLKELGELLKGRKDDLVEVIGDTEFPPKGVQGWLTLLLSLVASGFLNKIIVSGTRAIQLFKNIFNGTSTSAIVWGSAMIIAFAFSFWQVGWKFENIDFVNWAATTLFVSVFSMFIHETIKRLRTKKEIVEVA